MDQMAEDFNGILNLDVHYHTNPGSLNSGDDEVWYTAPSAEEDLTADQGDEEQSSDWIAEEDVPMPKVFAGHKAARNEALRCDASLEGPLSFAHDPYNYQCGQQKARQYVLHLHPDIERKCQLGQIRVSKGRYIHILTGPTGKLWIVKPRGTSTKSKRALFVWLDGGKGWSTRVLAEAVVEGGSTKDKGKNAQSTQSKPGKGRSCDKSKQRQVVVSKNDATLSMPKQKRNQPKETGPIADKKRKRREDSTSDFALAQMPKENKRARYHLRSNDRHPRWKHNGGDTSPIPSSDDDPNQSLEADVKSLPSPKIIAPSAPASSHKALIHFYMSDERFGTITHRFDDCSTLDSFFRHAFDAYRYTNAGTAVESKMGSISTTLRDGDVPKLMIWRNPSAFERFLVAAKRELLDKGKIDVRVRCHYKP